MACKDVGKQTDHQGKRLGEDTEEFDSRHQRDGAFQEHGHFRPKDFLPILLGAEYIHGNERAECQYQRNGDVAGHVTSTREYRYQPHDIVHENEEEGREQIGRILLVVLTDTALDDIFINNIMGLIPVFPGGGNVTGNIAITLVLALCTFIAVNVFGTKEYWKEILWPEVPVFLKCPIPLMPAIELFGIFTKPFALMIRLFANIFAGHSIILALTSIIFVTASMGAAISTSMSIVSVLFSIFMNCVEVLVAFIQAYVFTMLSSVFIGMSRVEPHHTSSCHSDDQREEESR